MADCSSKRNAEEDNGTAPVKAAEPTPLCGAVAVERARALGSSRGRPWASWARRRRNAATR